MSPQCRTEILSAYLDQELEPEEKDAVRAHLAGCDACRSALDQLSWTKSASRVLPKKEMPARLAALLEEKAMERLSSGSWPRLFLRPGFWVPAGGFAVALTVVSVWFLRGPSAEEGIPVDSVLAAHDRYLEEGALPAADLSGTSFSAKLALYQDARE